MVPERGGLETMEPMDKPQMISLPIQGKSNRETGETLKVSRNTAKEHPFLIRK